MPTGTSSLSRFYARELSWRAEAACANRWPLWAAAEHVIEERGRTGRRMLRYTILPCLEICADCPVRRQCLTWARADHYSGVAGGYALTGGRPIKP